MKLHIQESIHQIASNCYISDYVGNILDLINNKPKLYKIIYDAQADLWLIGDGNRLIHMDMMDYAWKANWYIEQEEFLSLFVVGRITNRNGREYFQCGTDAMFEVEDLVGEDLSIISDRISKDDEYIYPWLYCFVFVPNGSQYDDIRTSDSYGDGYNDEVELENGTLLLRDFKIDEVTDLAKRI